MAGAGATPPTGIANANQGNKRKLEIIEENVDSWGSTEMEEEEFTYLWTIKNYSKFSEKGKVLSPIFLGGSKSQHKWNLRIYPKNKIEDLEYFSVYLLLSDFGMGIESKKSLKACFEITLLDAHNRQGTNKGITIVREFKKGGNWGWNDVILTSKLMAHEPPLIVDDTLKIHCRVWIQNDVKVKTGKGGAYSENDRIVKQKVQVTTDLGESLRSTKFSDVVLTTPTKTCKAHKNILTCRSQVFAAMFSSEMLESTTNSVEIKDFDSETVEEMLNYIYTGEVKSLPEKALDLLRIADKYDLQGLKNECELTIAVNLNVETAAEVLILAHLHNANLLKPKVIDFVNRNKEAIRKSNGFQKVGAKNPTAAILLELYFSQ